jgi:hypothetical protein
VNVHARKEDKIDDMKDRFYGELENVFDKVLKYRKKILLGVFNAKIGRENISNQQLGVRVYMISAIKMELE